MIQSILRPRYSTDRDVLEKECTLEFVRASGPGGQHRNKRETGVRLTHLPSGTVVMATERRSQTANLGNAFERLIDILRSKNYVRPPRRPSRPTFASIKRRLESKKSRAMVKRGRQRPHPDD